MSSTERLTQRILEVFKEELGEDLTDEATDITVFTLSTVLAAVVVKANINELHMLEGLCQLLREANDFAASKTCDCGLNHDHEDEDDEFLADKVTDPQEIN